MTRVDLNGRSQAALFLGAALAFSVCYVFWVQNHYRAYLASEEVSLAGFKTAVRLEPSAAEYHDLLGRFNLFAVQDAKRAIPELQEAVRLDPYSSRYWLDLAAARGLVPDAEGQKEALKNALQVDPKTPSVAWEAGNFFLVNGDVDFALDSFKTVLEHDTVDAGPALELCWRATHDAKRILEHAMPEKVQPHLELLGVLMRQGQTDSLMDVWRSLVRLQQPYSVSDMMSVVDYLIVHHHIAAAQEVWSDMAKDSGSLRPTTADGNLIVNGSFDEEIVPGGFSWRVVPPASSTLRLDTQEFHTGIASASFTFSGPGFSDYGFSQLVPVKPNQLYEVRVTAKSQEIQSADGPRLMVEDAFTHAALGKGPEWQGTHGWNDESFMFTAPAGTEVVRLYLGRESGTGLIRGTLWLDNVRMYER